MRWRGVVRVMGCGASAEAAAVVQPRAPHAADGVPSAASGSSQQDVGPDGGSKVAGSRRGSGAEDIVAHSYRHNKKRTARRRGSAFAVSSERVTVVEKSAAVADMIIAAFRAKPVFTGLEDEVLSRAAEVMFQREYSAGDSIITQGDAADSFYVLAQGEVQVRFAKFPRTLIH